MEECTQRLDVESSQAEWTCPEQIGFLGILGTKYPVKKGPNKIGRDAKTCDIVLNLNSISRQHAVINVLNGGVIMLMDLDSANKTRLNNRSLQAYIPVPLANCDTVQFGEVLGVFRLLEDDNDLPSTQAIDVPETPSGLKPTSRLMHAVIPESPDVSDKDDSFIVPSQPKPGIKFKSSTNNFIKPSSKTIAIQPVGTNKIDNIFWSSSKKSNSFNLDDSTTSLNESIQSGDIHDKETQPPNESTDSIYTADTQLPPGCPSIHSQDTQLPTPDLISNKENCSIFNADTQLPPEKNYAVAKPKEHDIFNAETQLPNESKNYESIYDANTQLPFEDGATDNDNIFEAETQLPPNKFDFSKKTSKSIHEMDTQEPVPIRNESSDSIYTADTQLPPVNASPSIYSQETQLPKLNDFEIRDSPKSICDIKTQLPPMASKVSNEEDDDIFDAETQLPALDKDEDDSMTKNNENINDSNILLAPGKHDVATNSKNTSYKNKSNDTFNRSDEVILFDGVDTQNVLDDFNASQTIIGDVVPLQEGSEEIPLSQSDTITDDDFEIKLDEKTTQPAKRDTRDNSNNLTDCEDLDFLPTQKITEKPLNEEELTDCEEDETNDNKSVKSHPPNKTENNIEDLATQVIPTAIPASEMQVNFEDLDTQVIPQANVDNTEKSNCNSVLKPMDEPNLETMPTQVIPEINCDKETSFEDLQTQVIPENVPSIPTEDLLQCSEEVVANPFKVPLPTPKKMKRKEIYTSKPPNNTKPSVLPNADNEKYYAATQEIFDDLCSQKDLLSDCRTVNNNVLKIESQQDKKAVPNSVEDYKSGTKLPQLEGEMEISVKKFVREMSSESSEGENEVSMFVNRLSAKQICDVIGMDVAKLKRVPSDLSDGEVTPKKMRPLKFMETLLPDSQEIKTSVSLSSKTLNTESSSESEPEKESQEQTPIVFRKKKRVKADVKIDLSTKFDVQALPTRIITRKRKPTSKVQESDDVASKKRSRNILKPKFMQNDTEQDDEIDTEIISENITRLRTKNDKKNHKDTSDGTVKIEDVKPEHMKRNSNEENLDASKHKSAEKSKIKSKANSKDTVVDLTTLDDDKPRTRRRNEKSKNNKDSDANSQKIEVDQQKTNVTNSEISKAKPNEPPKIGRSMKKNVQNKITNYTIATDEPRTSNSQIKVDDSLNAADNNIKNTRSTRRSNKDKEICYKEKPVPIKQETKRTRGRPKKEDKEKDKKTDSKDKTTEKQKIKKEDSKDIKRREKDDSQDMIEPQEIRRSKRQKTTKEQNDSQSSVRKHEQSTVYNVSSESSDSPKRKREDVDTDAPNSKRTRSMTATPATIELSSDSSVVSNLNSNNSSLRSTPVCTGTTHRVLFTAFPCEHVKDKLEKLGAVIVSDVAACTVVLTLQLRRTFKLLCAVGLGRPIVGPDWVQACVDNNALVDPWAYLLRDATNEARFKFSLEKSLRGSRGYLRGCVVCATPNVLPSAPEMKLIVECSGGVWRDWGTEPRVARAQRWLAVSCAADRSLHASLRAQGATLVTSELILTGVLRQELNIDAYRIP